jgi:hypothetical protein
MEKENTGPVAESPGDTPTEEDGHERNAGRNEQKTIVENEREPLRTWTPQPTVLTLQDLIDLPRQVLPEQTYFHLRNAGREAILAVVSLVNSLSNSRRSQGDDKVRRHIDVE